MKDPVKFFKVSASLLPLLVMLNVIVFFQACKNKNEHANETNKEYVVDIITQNMDFQMPDTIQSGWINFSYKNQSPQTHFFLIEKFPDDKTLEDAKNDVVPHFSNGMKFINEGQGEKAMAEFGKLPEWYSKVEFLGGSGLISPGKTAETMVQLDPGYYLMECYVKMKNQRQVSILIFPARRELYLMILLNPGRKPFQFFTKISRYMNILSGTM